MQQLSKQLEFDPVSGEIRGPGGRVQLDPRVVAVLAQLAAAEGRLVSRDALIQHSWDGRVVSDSTVSAVISQLRSALRQTGVDDCRITTLSKRGYRFETVQASSRRMRFRAGIPAGGAALILLAGVLLFRTPALPGSLDGVRLDFRITLPNGELVEPVMWLEDGTPGEVRIDNAYPLELHVLPQRLDDETIHLLLEVGNAAHWSSNHYTTTLGSETHMTLRAAAETGEYDIRFSPRLAERPDFGWNSRLP